MQQKMKWLPKPKNHLAPRKLVAHGRLVQPQG